MVTETVSDIMYRFYDEIFHSHTIWVYNLETLDEIDRILEYANECLIEISKTYNSKQLHFTPTVRLQFVRT